MIIFSQCSNVNFLKQKKVFTREKRFIPTRLLVHQIGRGFIVWGVLTKWLLCRSRENDLYLCCWFTLIKKKVIRQTVLQRTLTFISSVLCASGSIPAAESSLIFCALDARSAMESVIFLCVWLDVEWGLKVSFSLNTDWACKPVPCTKKDQKKIIIIY